MLRLVLNQHKEWMAKGIEVEYCTIGNKGFGFVSRMGGKIVSPVVNYGDNPSIERLIGPVKMLIDGYLEGRIDEVHVFSTRFVNTMKQEPMHGPMIPIPQEWGTPDGKLMSDEPSAPATGTTSTSPSARRCSTSCWSATSNARVPGRGRQHRVRAVGAHGGHEGRLRQRAATSSTSCSSSTTRAGRLRSRRNSRRSSAARRRCSAAQSYSHRSPVTHQ